jgi:hypothetical protein
MAAKHTVNLLPKDSFEESSLGKFIKWATSIGRLIVVFADLIVIGSFLSRFYFDTKLADYHDDIKEKQAIVDATSQFENTFRAIQKRLSLIKALSLKKIDGEKKATFLNEVVPKEVSLSDTSITDDRITLSGTSLNQLGIAILIRNLLASPEVKNVNVSQFVVGDRENTGEIKFTLFVNWKS